VDEVIAHFGGALRMAQRLGLHRNSIYNMRYRGRIDPSRGLQINDVLQPVGLSLSRDLMRRGPSERKRPL
jgi:hypothetical protein